MPTIARGNTAEIYCPLATSVTFTPGSGGTMRVSVSSQSGNPAIAPQFIQSATSVSVTAGSTVYAEAITADATYTTPAGVDTAVSALASTYLFSSLPAASSMSGLTVFVSDVGDHGSWWRSNGTTWGLVNGACVLAQSAVAVSCTATTNEEALYSLALPAGVMGINGALRCSVLWTVTNSANNKTLRVRTGATALTGSAWAANVVTTTASQEAVAQTWRNRNAANSQITFVAANAHVGLQSSTANTTFTEDTSVAMVFSITGQKASAGETITLEGFTLELLRP